MKSIWNFRSKCFILFPNDTFGYPIKGNNTSYFEMQRKKVLHWFLITLKNYFLHWGSWRQQRNVNFPGGISLRAASNTQMCWDISHENLDVWLLVTQRRSGTEGLCHRSGRPFSGRTLDIHQPPGPSLCFVSYLDTVSAVWEHRFIWIHMSPLIALFQYS